MEIASIIARMIPRRLTPILNERLGQTPAVALFGPRQVGKTTLALAVSADRPSIYLDLESDAAIAKLSDPELYLNSHANKLVILDEVHRMPDLFRLLRGIIDVGRRQGLETGRFLLLGSASLDLLKQSSESLAGRISYLELQPLDACEVPPEDADRLWLRGGFPKSYLTPDDKTSLRWRLDFVRSYLERDIPQYGLRIPAETLRRFWTMLAHYQMSILNAAQLARNLGVDGKTVAHYIDLLVDLLLVRRLPAWHTNQGKRLIRSPRIYVRDSGIVHALLGIKDHEALLSHPVVGQSWEAYVIETLLAIATDSVQSSFYRTAAGAEVDLILTFADQESWAIEIKRSLSPKVGRGFHIACDDIKPQRRFVIYAGTENFPLGGEIEAISLRGLAQLLSSRI
jgi:uncharacterized protein